MYILSYGNETTEIKIVQNHGEADVITDLAWSKDQHFLLATSCGNGTLSLWQIDKKVNTVKAHSREISSIDWKNLIVLGSWDGFISTVSRYNCLNIFMYLTQSFSFFQKWNPTTMTKINHIEVAPNSLVHQAKVSYHQPHIFGCVSSKGTLNIWDLRSRQESLSMFHGTEVLCLEWLEHFDSLILTGSSDGVIRLWDVRNHFQPVKRFIGHEYAVRQIKNANDRFLSCSYDLTVRSWTLSDPSHHRFLKHHTEFVYGIDVCPFDSSLAVDCSWDTTLKLFRN